MARPDHASAAEIQKYLSGMDYPATKQQLADHAEGQGATLGVRTVIDALPEQEYDDAAAVSRAVGAVE